MTTAGSGWLRCFRPRPGAPATLVCLPHAGGAASAYRAWPELLAAGIELHAVQYPGREDRLPEPMVDQMAEAVTQISAGVATLGASKLVLFGHSMGGAIAYEVALRLRAQGLPEPDHLIISGRQPPRHHRGGDLHTRDEQALTAEIIRLRPATADLLADRQVASLVLPAVRNDYRLIETYRPGHAAPLGCPLTVLVGTEDTELTVAQAGDWRDYTTGPVRVHDLPGDHFYLVDQRPAVLSHINQALRGLTAPTIQKGAR